MKLFGTDGVRGRTSSRSFDDPILAFVESRIFTKELCAEIVHSANRLSDRGILVVGWDRRDSNEEIARHVVDRLKTHVEKIVVLSETSTPALQHEMVERDAGLGAMITASHNPACDSGVKILFRGGRKPTVDEERSIESGMFKEKGDGNLPTDISMHDSKGYVSKVVERGRSLRESGAVPDREILIDGSGGWISDWLCDHLRVVGINFREVGDRSCPINDNSGAGGLIEGDLSWAECKNSSHALLSQIKKTPKGEILGFCFDGDGDRCYLASSTETGVRIVGGDGFLRLLSHRIDPGDSYVVAITIESSLDVSKLYDRGNKGRLIETGVGDRWLQHALINNSGSLKFAAEPSGHTIMEQSINGRSGYWGDGVLTMFEFLDAIHSIGGDWLDIASTDQGFSFNQSISPSNRSLWDPDGRTGKLVTDLVADYFHLDPKLIDRREIEGEGGLLMLNFEQAGSWSLAVRNSGTEPKTRVTIRSTTEDSRVAKLLMEEVIAILKPELILESRS